MVGVGEGLNKSCLVSMAETGFTVLARAQEEPDCLSPKKPSEVGCGEGDCFEIFYFIYFTLKVPQGHCA